MNELDVLASALREAYYEASPQTTEWANLPFWVQDRWRWVAVVARKQLITSEKED